MTIHFPFKILPFLTNLDLEGKAGEEDKKCIKRDLGRVGGEWRTTPRDRRSWRLLIETVVRGK